MRGHLGQLVDVRCPAWPFCHFPQRLYEATRIGVGGRKPLLEAQPKGPPPLLWETGQRAPVRGLLERLCADTALSLSSPICKMAPDLFQKINQPTNGVNVSLVERSRGLEQRERDVFTVQQGRRRGGLMTQVIEHFLARLPREHWPLAQLRAELKQTPVAAICLILK